MYQALLTRRYLTSKIMPLLASLAVVLCVATELIVWSVMGGFLTMLVESGRVLIGDVAITWPIAGFSHYDDLRERLERSEVEVRGQKVRPVVATAPVIETYGLLTLGDGRPDYVAIKGIEGESYSAVTDYKDTLWWRPVEEPHPKDRLGEDFRLGPLSTLSRMVDPGDLGAEARQRLLAKTWEEMYRDGIELRETDPRSGERVPAVVLGIETSKLNMRQPGGWYQPGTRDQRLPDGSVRRFRTFLPNDRVTISVAPLDTSGRNVDVAARSFPVANEFSTGLYQIDEKTVLMPLESLQSMLKMGGSVRVAGGVHAGTTPGGDGREAFDEPAVVGRAAPRVTTVFLRAAPGFTAEELAAHAGGVYAEFAAAHPGEVPAAGDILISTWRDQNAIFIAAVEKETVLVMFIFGVISLTSVFLVLAIFWAMVSEKTKDIGVLRSIGASKAGVASVWLGYGLLIGVVGAAFGTGLAWLIVANINPIHEWMGVALGIQIWDPKVYYFTKIPNVVEPHRAAIIAVGGLLASVLGALWPAARAANMDPVRALRFE